MNKILAVFILVLSIMCQSQAQVKIIFDTDFGGDADDLGALAMLHTLVNNGECDLLAVMSWSTESKVIPAIDAVNRYYGHPDIPLGIRHADQWQVDKWNYNHPIAEQFPYELTNDDVMDATSLYRKILASHPDKSIVIVTVGPLANIQNLLQSEADEYSELTGKALIEKKVKEFVVMGGKFPEGKGEWNFDGRMKGVTKYVFEHLTVPVVFSGFEIGVRIKTGEVFNRIGKNTPLYVGFMHFSKNASWMKESFKGDILDNSTYDQTAILYAVRGGLGKYWTKVEGGYCEIDDNGDNRWIKGEVTNQSYLVLKEDPEKMASLIEKLMLDAKFTLAENNDHIFVEAEDFTHQSEYDVRKWYILNESLGHPEFSAIKPDIWKDASGESYIQILPDTRITHDDPFLRGENYSNVPGKLAVLHYQVEIKTPGRYYVWIKAFSSGTEDNGLHVGYNGNWPESGQRMQWCEGKNQWTWASKQRTDNNHCGIPGKIFLDFAQSGEYDIQFSMREDGFRFDSFILTPDINFIPQGNVDHDRNAESMVKKWEIIDLPFRTSKNVEQPFDVSFSAAFTHESGESIIVPGFFNGENQWVIRFSSAIPGTWNYLTNSGLEQLNSIAGKVRVSAENAENQHGAIKVSSQNAQRFCYEDGTSFFPLAFELDWLFALDAQNQDDIPRTKSIISAIKENGFNKVIMNVYAYDAKWGERDKIDPKYNFAEPEVFPFGGNNAHPDHGTINIGFFKHFDRVMQHLHENEIVSHLMIYVWNKKVNWPKPGSMEDNMYFDYVVKRYQAFPNLIWDISKEALAYGMDDMDYIVERIDRLRKLDGHKRLVTVHDYKFCRSYPGLVDFVSVQEWRPNLYNEMLKIVSEHPDKPVFNVEHGGYEKTMHSIFDGAYNDPVVCLERSYTCIFAGTYTTYYWQNSSWYELVFEPFALPEENQPHFHYYKHLTDFFSRYNYNKLVADQYFYSTYCLTDNDSTYLFLAPCGMNAIEGMPPENLRNKKVNVSWFNPLTGEYSNTEAKNLGSWMAFKKPDEVNSSFALVIVKIAGD